MSKTKILFQSEENIFGKFLRTSQYICYSGKLIIYKRKSKSVELHIKNEYSNFVLVDVMAKKKKFRGESISEVYSKLSKWLYNYEVIFQNPRKSKKYD